jgi:hypothetical protein
LDEDVEEHQLKEAAKPEQRAREVRRCAEDVSVQRSSQHRDWNDIHATSQKTKNKKKHT